MFHWGGVLGLNKRSEYIHLTDEVLVELSRGGDEYAFNVLAGRYLNTRSHNSTAAYLDSDDFVQEGMIGFLKAVKTYDFSRGVPFEAYAFKCMQNSINTAAGISRVEIPVGMSSEMPETTDTDDDPLKLILDGEHFNEVLNACETTLSDVEKAVVFFRAGGMAYEALNNASRSKSNFIIVLNDNNMSISENVGGVSKYLNNIRTADQYLGIKEGIYNSLMDSKIGEPIVRSIQKAKSSVKQLVIPGKSAEIFPVETSCFGQQHNVSV